MNRNFYNKLFLSLLITGAATCGLLVLSLVGTIAWYGMSALRLEFLLTESRNFGAGGGILYQIVGSSILITGAALISFPLALGTAIFKSEYIKNPQMQRLCAVLVYGLNGVPSIIFGIFGLIFFVNILNTGISWFVGAIILALMILPTVVLASFHAINSIPTIYRESAMALGLTKWQVILHVLIPQGIGGAMTGLFLGLARAVGETAPIMFIATAFSGADIPHSLFEPVAALPTHILALSQQATDPQALQNAWGASAVLVCLVLLFSVLGLASRFKLKGVRAS
ncbi:MAG: phosphate ABC transporter permease PstA [Candidatus Latescibacteria bacterium]|nr:phosphate ABC transporter permease PstA [Candidatus Latescibacterota bacterium]